MATRSKQDKWASSTKTTLAAGRSASRVEQVYDLWVFFHKSDAISHLLLCNLLEFFFQTAGSFYLLFLVAVDVLPLVDAVVNVYICS